MIPHSRPSIANEDVERVAAVVRSGQLAQGPEVAALERELASRLRVEAIAVVSSGTTALELALRALDVGPGHDVLIPSYVCDALHHAVTRGGAHPVLVDADPTTLSLSAKDAEARRTSRTRAVVVPHAFGLAVDLAPFLALGVPIIEDCAQALGAEVGGAPAGGAGTLGVCSFYATKMVAAGEGGAVVGPARVVGRVREAREYDERELLAPRGNAKLTDMQAALARSQLARLDAFVARRRAIAARYRARLARAECRLPPDVGRQHVYHRFVIGLERDPASIQAELASHGIAARRPVFRPIHRALGLDGYPEADRLWSSALSIPCYPALTDTEVDQVADALIEALRR
jgi:dTDP-4-amino-4,6-dideoxygalactose transaminase